MKECVRFGLKLVRHARGGQEEIESSSARLAGRQPTIAVSDLSAAIRRAYGDDYAARAASSTARSSVLSR